MTAPPPLPLAAVSLLRCPPSRRPLLSQQARLLLLLRRTAPLAGQTSSRRRRRDLGVVKVEFFSFGVVSVFFGHSFLARLSCCPLSLFFHVSSPSHLLPTASRSESSVSVEVSAAGLPSLGFLEAVPHRSQMASVVVVNVVKCTCRCHHCCRKGTEATRRAAATEGRATGVPPPMRLDSKAEERIALLNGEQIAQSECVPGSLKKRQKKKRRKKKRRKEKSGRESSSARRKRKKKNRRRPSHYFFRLSASQYSSTALPLAKAGEKAD